MTGGVQTGIPNLPIYDQSASNTSLSKARAPVPEPDVAPAAEPASSRAALHAAHQITQESLAALTAQSRYYPEVPEADVTTAPGAFSTGWMTPNELGADDARVVEALHHFINAQTMDEHLKAVANLARDATWDSAPLLVQGRDAIRVTAYAIKRLVSLDFQVLAAKSEILDPVVRRLHLDLLAHMRPRAATVWPLSLVLPQDIPVRVTVIAGRRKPANEPAGSFGLITWMKSRFHNLPSLPTPIRYTLGLLVGRGLSWTEGVWQHALPLMGDDSMQWAQKWAATSAGTQRMY